MEIGIIQYDVQWLDKESNFNQIQKYLTGLKTMPSIVFLPEMFDLGYILSPATIKNFDHEGSLTRLKQLSKKYKTILAGSIPTLKKSHYYNTFVFIKNENVIGTYDKIHLFSLAGEHKEYSPGNKLYPVVIDGIKINPLICYDLRFPYLSYNNQDIDLLVYVANWPKPRIAHWNALLKARAIENQCYVIGVNRTGKDENGLEYTGESQFIDYNGEVLLNAHNENGFFSQNLNFKSQSNFRKKFPFLRDQLNY